MTNFSSRSAAAVAPLLLKEWLHDGAEIALLDVREHGQYGESHLFYAVSLPWSRLELDIGRLVPRRSARVVVYDEGDGLARQAAERLQALGYSEVYWLEGGTPAWLAAGLQLFAGVNVPSKTFGELAEHAFDTPRIRAEELAAMQARGEAVVIVDGRPYNEYRKMNIPGSICCPNGELALHIDTLVPDETTPIVVNCAGRTRSIIGAQTLINLGLPNPVYALENGTQGWFLADLKLEHGAQRRYEACVPAG
ncbi:rhodanese-like domain-containing protein, partial [Bordetella trematum]|uniref:rhodanese-like domain-containing protein n=1 Tax=Bordetella trematum TaxID=123899 RepID=UPI003D0EFF0A